MTAVADLNQRNADADERFTAILEAAEGQTKATVRLVGDGEASGNVKQAASKDGVRRFQIGRRIVSVDTIVDAWTEEPVAVSEPAATANGAAATQRDKEAAKPAKAPAEKVTLTSGAVVTGKTVTIRCAWVDPERRTKAQQKLFETNFAGVEPGKGYEAMVKAAGNGKDKDKALPDGSERTIKVQDAFQVRFSTENQKRHRNEQRRRKARERRAAREAARAAKS